MSEASAAEPQKKKRRRRLATPPPELAASTDTKDIYDKAVSETYNALKSGLLAFSP